MKTPEVPQKASKMKAPDVPTKPLKAQEMPIKSPNMIAQEVPLEVMAPEVPQKLLEGKAPEVAEKHHHENEIEVLSSDIVTVVNCAQPPVKKSSFKQTLNAIRNAVFNGENVDEQKPQEPSAPVKQNSIEKIMNKAKRALNLSNSSNPPSIEKIHPSQLHDNECNQCGNQFSSKKALKLHQKGSESSCITKLCKEDHFHELIVKKFASKEDAQDHIRLLGQGCQI